MKITWKPVVRYVGGKPKKTGVTEGRLEGRDNYAAPITIEVEKLYGDTSYKLTVPGDRPRTFESMKEAKDAAAESMQEYADTLDRIEYVVVGDYLWDRPENHGASNQRPIETGTVVRASSRQRFRYLKSALAWSQELRQESDAAGYIFRIEAWRERDGVRKENVAPTMIRDSRGAWREESAGGGKRRHASKPRKAKRPAGALTLKQFAAAMKARKIGA